MWNSLRVGSSSLSSFAVRHGVSSATRPPFVLSARLLSSSSNNALRDSYDNVIVERRVDASQPRGSGVGLVQLHRPKALNALSDALFQDLIHATRALDADDDIGCLVVTGSKKAFAAGADISEMKDRTFDEAYKKVHL
jgi:1,4-dihydroxy-2-naphthoyl-CoA synthase